MSQKISFYVFSNGETKEFNGFKGGLLLNEAIELFKKVKKEITEYTSIGVEIGDSCCDLIISDKKGLRISMDYEKVNLFKDNKLVSVNAISILNERFKTELR